MQRILNSVMLTILCFTAVLAPTSIPFTNEHVAEAATEKQFNKSSKIYASRSQKAKVVMSVKKGQTVTLLETAGSWSKVRIVKKTGWTASRDLSVVKERIAVDRLSKIALYEKVKQDAHFKKNERFGDIMYEYVNKEENFLRVMYIEDKGILAMSHWFHAAYKPGVRPKEREALMKHQYESLQLMGELMYGAGTQEAKNYTKVASEHMADVEQLVMKDWHKRMHVFEEGTFRVNGDTFGYYKVGPGFEVWYK